MDYYFEFVLLDRQMVNMFLKQLHRPEPSGYGTLPDDDMNVAWGVHEQNTGITLTKAFEHNHKEFRRKKCFHLVAFDVMSEEGCFGACYKTNYKGGILEPTRFYYNGDDLFTAKYLDVVNKAISFYEDDGIKNGDFEKFSQQFEDTHKMSVDAYEKQVYKEVYEEWKRKWPGL